MSFHFGCIETSPGIWAVQFDGPTPFKAPSCWEELKQLSLQHEKLLVLGIFGWNNYSHRVVSNIIDNKDQFEEHCISLAAFCPSSISQVRLICPDFLPHFLQANTEPLMFVLEGGSLKKARFGPLNSPSILNWVLSD